MGIRDGKTLKTLCDSSCSLKTASVVHTQVQCGLALSILEGALFKKTQEVQSGLKSSSVWGVNPSFLPTPGSLTRARRTLVKRMPVSHAPIRIQCKAFRTMFVLVPDEALTISDEKAPGVKSPGLFLTELFGVNVHSTHAQILANPAHAKA